MIARSESYGEDQNRYCITLMYRDLMNVIRLDPDDDLVGVLELSTGQSAALCGLTDRLGPLPAGWLYAINLATVIREQQPQP